MNTKSLVRLGSRRLMGAMREALYLHAGIDVTRPETIRATVTRRCNFKCQYCYDWQIDRHPELSIEEWEKALLGLREYLGRYVVLFSGGEPFVKKGFVNLLEFCHAHAIAWGVITNGSAFSDAVTERVVGAGPLNIDISVDSSLNEINDQVRGFRNSLRHIGDGMRRLTRERERRSIGFIIRVKPTVTRQNFRTLPELVQWSIDQGADSIDFSPVRPQEFWEWDKSTYQRLWIDDGEIGELMRIVDILCALKRNGAPIETSMEKLRSFADHFSGLKVRHGASPCRVGLRDFHISPAGDVSVCWEHPNIGNVTEQSVGEIWEGAKAREVRSATTSCSLFNTIRCANSCLNHKTLRQDAGRAIHWLKLGN